LCGASAYYDGRCGDGPILMCGCDKQKKWYVDEKTGKAVIVDSPAQPVREEEWK
jgi:hypothetical protein